MWEEISSFDNKLSLTLFHSLILTLGFEELTGSVEYIHQWIDMSKYEVTLEDGSVNTTCKPALGYSFAAGTTDGPGEFDFTQGVITGNPFWDFISGLLKVT